jgi:hypothetical protein
MVCFNSFAGRRRIALRHDVRRAGRSLADQAGRCNRAIGRGAIEHARRAFQMDSVVSVVGASRSQFSAGDGSLCCIRGYRTVSVAFSPNQFSALSVKSIATATRLMVRTPSTIPNSRCHTARPVANSQLRTASPRISRLRRRIEERPAVHERLDIAIPPTRRRPPLTEKYAASFCRKEAAVDLPREPAMKKPAALAFRATGSILVVSCQLPSIVWITLDIGRASSRPPPISLSTISLYSGSGSTGVLPVICTTL